MKTFLLKLTSRKLLMAVAAVATLLANKQYPAAAAVAVAYVAAETHLDKTSIMAEAMQLAHDVDPAIPEMTPAVGFAAPDAPAEPEVPAVPASHGQIQMGFAGKGVTA